MHKRIYFIVAFLFAIILSASTFDLVPMIASIAPSGPQSIITFKITNDSSKSIAVSIKLLTRQVDENGVESNQATDKQFLLFPSRVVLEPNSMQNVKVQYRGSASISSEYAFRVIAEQLPVAFDKSSGSGISILLRYIASLYVTPKGAASNVVLTKIIGAKKDDKTGLLVTLDNKGTKHSIIKNALIRINESSGFREVEFKGESMAGFEGQNILAASKRIFFIPWEPAELGVTYEGIFNAEFES